MQRIVSVGLVVHDYDAAIRWLDTALRFVVVEDVDLGDGLRRVRVGPAKGRGATLRLTRADTPAQARALGRQGGGGALLVVETDDVKGDRKRLRAAGARLLEQSRDAQGRRVVAFEDPWGNRWELVQAAG